MPAERFNPAERAPSPGYTEIAVTGGQRLVLLACQCPLDADGQLVGGDDVRAQTRQVVENLQTCLDAAAVPPGNVLKTTVYVVGDRPALLAAWKVFADSGVTGVPLAPSTLIGVTSLGFEGQLVEIEALAVLD